MALKWVIIFWFTRNSASARHVASADCCIACVVYLLQHYCSYSVPRYNWIYWQQSGQGKVAAGGCPSALGSGARQRPVQAPVSAACAASSSRCWQHPPMRFWKPEARVNARRRVKDRSRRDSSKRALKPEPDAQIPRLRLDPDILPRVRRACDGKIFSLCSEGAATDWRHLQRNYWARWRVPGISSLQWKKIHLHHPVPRLVQTSAWARAPPAQKK